MCALSPNSFTEPLKVFIPAGQSNMEGHGVVQSLDQSCRHPTHGHLVKKVKKADGLFVVRDDVFVSYKNHYEKSSRPALPHPVVFAHDFTRSATQHPQQQ
jgi:hypothetical protein